MIRRLAHAKINIGLRILSKRNDGFHNIETIFHRIALHDEITFNHSERTILSTNSSILPIDNTNLCLQAVTMYNHLHFQANSVSIDLTKRIPLGAGLGGGSSDAASTLLALNELSTTPIRKEELSALAIKLGSDVPYFLSDGTARATGRGELLEYFRLELPYSILLIYPRVHIETAWAYKHIEPNLHTDEENLRTLLLRHLNSPDALQKNIRNDFEPIVLKSFPEVNDARNRLNDLGACFVQLSGSGSSVYGFFTDNALLSNAVAELEPRYDLFVTPPFFQAVV